jgi:HAD superfamily hydrolase (TIGR01509 family)
MDGVLFDSEPLHIRTWQALLGELGLIFPPEWFQRWIGISDRLLAAELRAQHGVALSMEELLARKRAFYYEMTARELRPFPGVAEGLADLRARGVPFAVATSCLRETTEHTLGCTGLLPLCAVVVTADDVARLKPHPDCFLEAAARLGVAPPKCLVLEDSPVGLAAARAAGCRAVGIASSLPAEKLAGAERVFPTTVAALEWARVAQASSLHGRH